MSSRRMDSVRRASMLIGMVGLVGGCSSPSEPVAPQLQIWVGNRQLAEAGTALFLPLGVRVTDSHGSLLRGIAIDWTVAIGGGSLSHSSVQTNAHGQALTNFMLGPDDGVQAVRATVHGLADVPSVTFTATAVTRLVHGYEDDNCWWYGYADCVGFDADEITISAGRTIGWTWSGTHNITFEDDAAEPTSSATINNGSHMRRFDEPGTYRYRCTRHSSDFEEGMVGSISVLAF
jgi:plastocyanin